MVLSKPAWLPLRTPRISYVLDPGALDNLPLFREQVILAAGTLPSYEGQTWIGQRYAITIYQGYAWYTASLYVEVDERLNNGTSTIKCLSTFGFWTKEKAEQMARAWERCLATSPPIFGDCDEIEPCVRECSLVHFDDVFGIRSYPYSEHLRRQVERTSSSIYFPAACLQTPDNYLRPGDHVVAWRGKLQPFTYHHDGIYAGNRRVIHMTYDQKVGSSSSNEEIGRVSNVDWNTFIGTDSSCTIGVFIYEIRMRTAEHILALAELCAGGSQLQHTYHLFSNNCQHFATLCSSGIRFSREADGYAPVLQNFGNMVLNGGSGGC